MLRTKSLFPFAILTVFVAACAGAVVMAAVITHLRDRTNPEPSSFPPALVNPPPLPKQWPTSLELGMMSAPGEASAMRQTAPFGFRYQYLAGGVNTGTGWATWQPDGSFVSNYIDESQAVGMNSVFSYYMLYQSKPGDGKSEKQAVLKNLQNKETMRAYWQDVKLFFQRAGARGELVVLHVEPDLWSYVQQASKKDDASSVTAIVGSSGLPELQQLPDNFQGFAKAFLRLRDTYADNVLIAYHYGTWGSGEDPVYSNPTDERITKLLDKSVAFYRSLDSDFDLVFSEFADRDAGFKQHMYGAKNVWWSEGDFARNLKLLSGFVSATQKRVVMWQIPFGNTLYRSLNNSWGHFQDNKVQLLLGDAQRELLLRYAQAGVIGFFFGGGAAGVTCPCDANHNGITNPEPINQNSEIASSSDDDGGYFRIKAAEYYREGRLVLP